MMPSRHNLSRRAVLGAGVGACALADGRALAVPLVQGAEQGRGDASSSCGAGRQAPNSSSPVAGACPERSRRAWRRTLAAYRRAEARVAAFKADEALLPPARRAWPQCRDLEQRFGDLDARRLNLLRRLLRTSAPDLPALALKLELAVADLAWELTGCETCFEHLAADARRLADAT